MHILSRKPVILFQYVSHDIQAYRDVTTSLDGVPYVLVTMHPPQYYCRRNSHLWNCWCSLIVKSECSRKTIWSLRTTPFNAALAKPVKRCPRLTFVTLVARMAAADRNWLIVPNARKNFEASRSQILNWFVGFDLAAFKVWNLPRAETPTEVSSSSDWSWHERNCTIQKRASISLVLWALQWLIKTP